MWFLALGRNCERGLFFQAMRHRLPTTTLSTRLRLLDSQLQTPKKFASKYAGIFGLPKSDELFVSSRFFAISQFLFERFQKKFLSWEISIAKSRNIFD